MSTMLDRGADEMCTYRQSSWGMVRGGGGGPCLFILCLNLVNACEEREEIDQAHWSPGYRFETSWSDF